MKQFNWGLVSTYQLRIADICSLGLAIAFSDSLLTHCVCAIH